MQYLLLIYDDPSSQPTGKEAFDAMMADYGGYTAWLRETGQFLGGEALQPVSDATTVSIRDGRRVVTDGPFAETKEHLGGYYLIDVPGLDDAIEVASRIPGASIGRIEIRPIKEFG